MIDHLDHDLPRMSRTLRIILAAWVLAAAGGAIGLLAQETRVSGRRSTPATWPADSRIQRARNTGTMLVFVHPNCPCTRATVARILDTTLGARAKTGPAVVFVARPAADDDWRATWLLDSAARTPGSRIVSDDRMTETALFGVETSGHVLLYDSRGALLFDGGVTAGRGHRAPNAASDALSQAIVDNLSNTAKTAVFGCDIRNRRRTT